MVSKQIEATIQPITFGEFKLQVEGITSLLMNKFSDRARQGLLDKQSGKSKEKTKRSADEIKKEIEEKIHRLPNGKVGFPSAGFKGSMVEAAKGKLIQGLDGKLVKGSFQVIGNLVPIKYKQQKINDAIARLPNGVPMVVFRPEFVGWEAELLIRYNASQITPQQIIALANVAGFHIGIGDWRPYSKKGNGGQFGMYKVKANGEAK